MIILRLSFNVINTCNICVKELFVRSTILYGSQAVWPKVIQKFFGNCQGVRLLEHVR